MRHHRFTNSTGTISVRGTPSGGVFKSKLERHAFIRWIGHPDVESVKLQEPRIVYLNKDGNKRRYTGDLLVSFRPQSMRRPLVVECKYSAKLKRDRELVEKLRLVGNAMRNLDRDFLIQTEHDVHAGGFKMMKFVFSHHNNDPHPAQSEILECMATHKSMTLEQLLKNLRADFLTQCELIPEVWRLVATRKLTVDYSEILNLSAKISLPSV